MNNLRELIEKSKVDLLMEQKGKAQLAAECNNLRNQLIEIVRSIPFYKYIQYKLAINLLNINFIQHLK